MDVEVTVSIWGKDGKRWKSQINLEKGKDLQRHVEDAQTR